MARIIAVAQQKGGAGKTSLAIHLACAFVGQGKSVALIDLDPQESLSSWYKLRIEQHGTSDDLRLRTAAGWRAQTEIDRLKKEVDIILIDSPPHAETAARLAVRAADLVLVPVQLSPMDIWASEATLTLIKREKAASLIVLNRVPPRGRLADDLRARLDDAGHPLAEASLGNRTAFAASLMEGLGVSEFEPGSMAAAEIASLADEIWGL